VTQWDGLGHVGYDGLLYNNVSVDSISTIAGSSTLSIDQIAKRGIVGRGVLLDIARLDGVDRLTVDYAITPDDLDAAEAKQGVKAGPGDIVLVRTGWLRNFTVDGSIEGYWNGSPGLTFECAEWLHKRDIAAIASDNWGVEIVPQNVTELPVPFHCVAIRDMGMTLGEIFVLDELGDACERSGRWSFFFTAPPLLVVGGVGSPITPLAIF
jgi:kynurenine formamidase